MSRTAWKHGDRIECDMTFVSHTIANAPEGYIAGIASTPATDLYGHRVLKGAFDESIRKKGLAGPRGVKLLAGHDWHKIAGTIKKLETIGDNLGIEAQLNLNVSYVKDLYEVTKQNGGLNFSVGFALKEFEFVDDEEIENEDDAWLIIKQGDLMEVSVVAFPACLEAEMTFVKHEPPTSLSEFERALVAQGLCRTRTEARKLTLAVKQSSHLFGGPAPAAPDTAVKHPLMDVSRLQPVRDLIAQAKATLSSR
jgi:HK97 family phage prohead protease